MPLLQYWDVLRRRWWIVVGILLLDLLVSGYLYRKASHAAGFRSCVTLYVADVGAPGMIAAPDTTLQTTGALLAGETAANFFADDIKDVAGSGRVAAYVNRRLRLIGKPADVNGAVDGSRLDRTVNLCVTNPDSAVALAAGRVLGSALTAHRAQFVGAAMARRTYVSVISDATVGPAPASHQVLNLALRLLLGLLVALGAAFLWEALDPTVRTARDVEQALGVPVLSPGG